MKLFRTVNRGYVYQPYLREVDAMVDPRDQKYMPHKRDMIFVRRKGPQSAPGPEIPDETEEAALGEEEAPTEEPRSEHMEQASTSRGNQGKLDGLIADFEDFKAQTQLNFEALKQQMQTNQEEHLSNFGTVIKLLEGI